MAEAMSDELRDVERALPSSFYAGRPLPDRVRLLVELWRRAIERAAELELEVELLTVVREVGCACGDDDACSFLVRALAAEAYDPDLPELCGG